MNEREKSKSAPGARDDGDGSRSSRHPDSGAEGIAPAAKALSCFWAIVEMCHAWHADIGGLDGTAVLAQAYGMLARPIEILEGLEGWSSDALAAVEHERDVLAERLEGAEHRIDRAASIIDGYGDGESEDPAMLLGQVGALLVTGRPPSGAKRGGLLDRSDHLANRWSIEGIAGEIGLITYDHEDGMWSIEVMNAGGVQVGIGDDEAYRLARALEVAQLIAPIVKTIPKGAATPTLDTTIDGLRTAETRSDA